MLRRALAEVQRNEHVGISRSAVRALLHEAKRAEFRGRILSLGRQDIFVTRPQFIETMRDFGIEPARHAERLLSRKVSEANLKYISDEYLFHALGFSECKSLDASGYEDADIVFDMNKPKTPADLVNQWDVVFDGGTIEHIFHIPNVMANIFRFLKIGGRIIHMAPSSNHMDHGFYMFSPTLFWDYYMANGFDINVCQVFRYTTDWLTELWEFSDYIPGRLTRISLGGLDDAIYGVFVIATKTEESTCDVVPQQGMYKEGRWKGKFTVDEIAAEVEAASGLEPAAALESISDPEAIEYEGDAPKETLSQRLTWSRIMRSLKYRIKRRVLGILAPPPTARKDLGLKIRYRL
jgi:hypothetical protein